MRAIYKPGQEEAEGKENLLTEAIIGAAIEVHRHLGPGLLESAYEECLCLELSRLAISFRRQVAAPIEYKGLKLDCAYRLDLVVEDRVIVELKAADDLLPIHSSQLLSYLKAQKKKVGLLINFNVPILKNGIKRIVNRYAGPLPSNDNSASSAISDVQIAAPSNGMTEHMTTQNISASSSASPRLRVEQTAAPSASARFRAEETPATYTREPS